MADKPCRDCGIMMIDVHASKLYCPTCRNGRRAINKLKYLSQFKEEDEEPVPDPEAGFKRILANYWERRR